MPTGGLVGADRLPIRGTPGTRSSRPNWDKSRTYRSRICPSGPTTPYRLTPSPPPNRGWGSMPETWPRILTRSIRGISGVPVVSWSGLGLALKRLDGWAVGMSWGAASCRKWLGVLIF